MPTFLTTSKMSPELVERIEASVRGRKRKAGGKLVAQRIVKSMVRIGLVFALAVATASVTAAERRARQASELSQRDLESALRCSRR